MSDLHPFRDDQVLDGYVTEAAWFWFHASTLEMSLEVRLHRLLARCIGQEIARRGLLEPDAEEIYQQARRSFPLDDLRPHRLGAAELRS